MTNENDVDVFARIFFDDFLLFCFESSNFFGELSFLQKYFLRKRRLVIGTREK